MPALPSDEDTAQTAKRVLLDIAINGGGPDAGARVGAAKALLETTTDGPQAVLVRILGDEKKAVEWMRNVLPALEAGVDKWESGLAAVGRTLARNSGDPP